MPWRLLVFIILFLIFFLFITFNLENKCDISFGFTEINDVPVFVTVFSTFIAGLLCALPFIFSFKSRKKGGATHKKGAADKKPDKQEKDFSEKPEDASLSNKSDYGID